MNATNGRIDADPIESRGGPPTAVPEGADANKLTAAKDAAKKKLLRLVVQQAAEELGDPEAIVEQAFREGLFSDELISGLRAGVRDRMTRRLIDHIAQEGESGLAADAALALADSPEVKAAVDSVERKLAGTIAAKALERMEDEAAIADSIFDQIARVNDVTMSALSEDVRGLVVQSIADRAWASSVDPDEILKVAESRINANDPAIEAAAVEIRKAAIEQIRTLVDQDLSTSEVMTGLAEDAARRIEGLLMERVSEEVRTSGIEARVSESVTEAVSGRIAESVFETDTLLKRVEERLEKDGVRLQEAAEQARAEFAVQLTDDLIAAVTADEAIDSLTAQAVAEVRVRIAQDVCARVTAIPAGELATEATGHFDHDDELVLAAVGTARVELLKEIARRAEASLTDSVDAARQALAAFTPNEAVVTDATDRLRSEVITLIAGRVADELSSHGITSNDAAASEILEASTKALRQTLLEQIVASVATDESRSELRAVAVSDPAIAHLVGEIHDEVWATLAARLSSRVLASSPDQLASAALARVESDAAPLVAAGEAVHAHLVQHIAEQATSNLTDIEKTVTEALAHVPGDAQVLVEAMESLKANLTKHVADRVLDDLEQNGIPTDDPRMTAAAQSVRTLVSGILYAQAMKVATTSKERDRVAQEVARDVHDLLVTDTIEAFSKRNPAELAEEARSRIADSNMLISEASERLADVMAGHVARLAEAALRADGVDFEHPTVAAVMVALQADVRVAIAERAYQTVADSDTKTQLAADIAARVHDAVTSEALRGILGRNPAEMAQAIAAQISEDEPVIARATESVMASLRADIARSVGSRIDAEAEANLIARSIADDSTAVVSDLMHSVADSLREYAKDRAIEEVGSSDSIAEITASGYDVLRDRLVVSIAQRSASMEAGELAGEAASLLGDSPLVAEEASTLLHARMVESIATKAVDQLGSVAAASEKARIIAESDDTVVEDAVRTLYDLLASQVGEEVTRRIHQADRLAQAAASFVDPDDPAVDAAADDVANDLGRLVAVRAVDQLSSASGRARIVAEATGACSDEMESSVRDAEDRLMQTIVARIAGRFSDAGDTARRAQEKLGTDHAPLIAAGEVLKELVLEDLSRKATIMLLDASQAADRAFSRIDLDDPRFQKAQDTLRTRIVDAVAERSLQALEDMDSAAGMVRARIPEDHEHVVGTAALVRDMLLDDIARRSESSLNDTRTAARLSRQRVPENSVNLTSASEALRDLLLDDLVHLATSAFGDATAAAEQAMLRVDGDEDVLVRARAAFKERILMSVLGEAIREIGGAFGSGRADAQQAVFQQAMTAMARQSGAFQPAPDRSPMADYSRPASSEEAQVPFVPASEVSGTPSGAVTGTEETSDALRTAALSSVSDEGWTRLSDLLDHETESVQAEDSIAFRFNEDPAPEVNHQESPVDHQDFIVTEFIEMDADETEEDEVEEEGPFVFAWAADDVHSGDSMSPIHGVEEPVASVRIESSGDGASNPGSSVQLPWDESAGHLAYVYGFVPTDDASLPLGSSLIGMDPANPVRFVTVRGVRAITSMVSADEFSPDAMSNRSQDTSWLREHIRIHARVLDAFKSTTTVVPLRFGSIFENEADVAAMIDARYSRLTETLDRLAGRLEWGVRAVRNLDRMRNRVLQTERTIDESLASLSTGVAQFVRDEMTKSTDLEEASLIETVTRHCLTRVDEALSRWADDGAEKSLVPSHAGDVVMNRAYLVAQTAVEDFRAELTRLGAEFGSIGLSFEMTGPWPAFHFSSLDDDHLAGTVPAQG